MVGTYIYAGLRRAEAVWLTVEDVELRAAPPLLRVRAKEIDGEFWEPKTKRNRVVPISSALRAVLAEWMARRPVGPRWFFPSSTGRRYDEDAFSRKLKRLQRRVGLPWNCLDFRHTFGSQLAQKGESLYRISVLMGNSPEICRRHYATLVPEVLALGERGQRLGVLRQGAEVSLACFLRPELTPGRGETGRGEGRAEGEDEQR